MLKSLINGLAAVCKWVVQRLLGNVSLCQLSKWDVIVMGVWQAMCVCSRDESSSTMKLYTQEVF